MPSNRTHPQRTFPHRPRRIMAGLLVLLFAGPLAAADLTPEMSAEQVAAESYARMRAGDWQAAAETFDPAALKQFRDMMAPMLEGPVGEAMAGGPVMLSWADVDARDPLQRGHNVVIHEFVHKMDMRHRPLGEEPSGQPALPARFMGLSAGEASAHWQRVMQQAYADFSEQVSATERFGEPSPWLDAYAATAPAEFFAVTCEAYFVQRARFDVDFPALRRLYDAFFDPHSWLQPTLSGAPAAP